MPFNIMPAIDPQAPLSHPAFAIHLQMAAVTEETWPELLRRTKRIEEVFGLLMQDGQGNEISMATEEIARQHIGQRWSYGVRTAAEFDDRMDILHIKNNGGFPGIWMHTRLTGFPANDPCDVYVELNREYDNHESRRVFVFRDGRHLPYVDGYNEATGERFEDGFADAVTIQSQRHRHTARVITEAEFNQVWNVAESTECRWPMGITEPTPCGRDIADGAAWCTHHTGVLRAMLPRVF